MTLTDTFNPTPKPYREPSLNTVYELLFGDNTDLYKNTIREPYAYPWNILMADSAYASDLQRVAADPNVETRAKILAYNRLRNSSQRIAKRELLAVIIEVGLDDGLDVLASFQDGTARYINHSEKVIIWETTDAHSHSLTHKLFKESISIVSKIGPWNGERRPYPEEGNVRISFLVSDGLYFGEGPINVLFNDALARPALQSATELMQYLTEKAISTK
ncbi:hypothetical protein [Larkinella terrae]|uniref:Uncharacterized protein n=1 Tax=Larkinella terrae TaxID=2025311 RepID=A0A7K0ESH0_9BACT|nr:hypothetical protein [Larkinella terrae]MRS64763.1 hypothetical protein [Larkinella terrae]